MRKAVVPKPPPSVDVTAIYRLSISPQTPDYKLANLSASIAKATNIAKALPRYLSRIRREIYYQT